MPLQTVSTQRLYRQIADQLAELIRSGEFQPGDRLPSERDLAQQLGVSRASVREALIALEIDGLIDIRVGSGVYVTAPRAVAANSVLVAEPGPFEVLAARGLVEAEAAALAALNATAEDHARIRETLALMRAEFDASASALDGDALFHVRIAEASANGALAHLVKTLWDFRQSAMFRKLDQHFDVPARHAAAIDEHLAVIEAIERRDADAARAAMLRHIDNVKSALERNLELPPAAGAADGAAVYS
ncbi:FadR/GntR family transcriptional regulator [Azohydromonas lata]|uniref:FadR/GntR family transcriptional regulator n=1 Tax=Azohydromonas lata TaxID=45677 RepID=A0ABU5IR92_9BURK|nr:FadR/GntR family transcriptional regulator [Azohydromonas lata]MDZ5461422.1 FadR/GntR family transcriptional regulator [Azohydromonas lata]